MHKPDALDILTLFADVPLKTQQDREEFGAFFVDFKAHCTSGKINRVQVRLCRNMRHYISYSDHSRRYKQK